MSNERLEHEFAEAMRASCRESVGLGYYPTRFLEALERRGAVAYAKQLVASGDLQSGLRRLCGLDRLDLSIEHLIAEDLRFRELFTEDDREAARWRLDQVRNQG